MRGGGGRNRTGRATLGQAAIASQTSRRGSPGRMGTMTRAMRSTARSCARMATPIKRTNRRAWPRKRRQLSRRSSLVLTPEAGASVMCGSKGKVRPEGFGRKRAEYTLLCSEVRVWYNEKLEFGIFLVKIEGTNIAM